MKTNDPQLVITTCDNKVYYLEKVVLNERLKIHVVTMGYQAIVDPSLFSLTENKLTIKDENDKIIYESKEILEAENKRWFIQDSRVLVSG